MTQPTPNRVFKVLSWRVVDGDTMHATLDVGFDISVDIDFRLFGIDAPEHITKPGADSRTWLISTMTAAKAISIRTHHQPKGAQARDRYGRWLAEVFVDGGSVAELSVAAGHALPWDGSGPHPYDPTTGLPVTT